MRTVQFVFLRFLSDNFREPASSDDGEGVPPKSVTMFPSMVSLVYDWLLSAGDEKLAKTFKKEAKAEPLPPNSPRLADIVKHYKETSPQKRKAEPVVNGSAKKAKKVAIIATLHFAPSSLSSRCKALG